MPKIKPVSDLRNYNEVLKEITDGTPVFLTRNGRGKFAIMDIEDYEKNIATIKLLTKLIEAENRVKTDNDWMSEDLVRDTLGI